MKEAMAIVASDLEPVPSFDSAVETFAIAVPTEAIISSAPAWVPIESVDNSPTALPGVSRDIS